jgi:anti-sigma factor RsiW
MNKKILDLLVRSFDGSLTAEDREALEGALAASRELREERARLAKLRAAVSSAKMDSFSPFFVERVMQRVCQDRMTGSGREAFSRALARSFRPIAIAGAVLSIGLLIYNFVETNEISLPGAVGLSRATYEEMMEQPADAIAEVLS